MSSLGSSGPLQNTGSSSVLRMASRSSIAVQQQHHQQQQAQGQQLQLRPSQQQNQQNQQSPVQAEAQASGAAPASVLTAPRVSSAVKKVTQSAVYRKSSSPGDNQYPNWDRKSTKMYGSQLSWAWPHRCISADLCTPLFKQFSFLCPHVMQPHMAPVLPRINTTPLQGGPSLDEAQVPIPGELCMSRHACFVVQALAQW